MVRHCKFVEGGNGLICVYIYIYIAISIMVSLSANTTFLCGVWCVA